jgi:zinc transporter, ZIP family
LRRRAVAIVVLLAVTVATAAAAVLHWRGGAGEGGGAASIRTASLRPGQITLLLANESQDTTRLAQIILNDAYVDFRASTETVDPGRTARITISYPWIEGESYDVEVLTSTGASIDYEIEDASSA